MNIARQGAPLLTIVVPAYNAEAYLRRAVDSLVDVAASIEVVIVDDGSTDGTGVVADDYARRFPRTVRAVHQENRGHGGAINAGLDQARGLYIKVLDADDWLNPVTLMKVVNALEEAEAEGGVDAFFTDYRYVRAGRRSRRTDFRNVFPVGRPFGWVDTELFLRRQYLMMHAVIFRTGLLRNARIRLPAHTFYVDSLLVIEGLRSARRMRYLPEVLYNYLIGRPGQSVEAAVMLTRVEDQLRVNLRALKVLPSPASVPAGNIPAQLHTFLLHHVEAICMVTSATLARGGTAEHLSARQAFWAEVKAGSPWLYARMRRSLTAASSNLPGTTGSRVTTLAYHVARRVVGFS